MAVSLPACAHRVTVFGSTRNNAATSAGVSSLSCSNDPMLKLTFPLVVEPPLRTCPLRLVRCSTAPTVPWASTEQGGFTQVHLNPPIWVAARSSPRTLIEAESPPWPHAPNGFHRRHPPIRPI